MPSDTSKPKDVHNARDNRHTVFPMMYSVLSPLVLPRFTERMICGNHMHECVMTRKIIESIGERMTFTMTMIKANHINPKK